MMRQRQSICLFCQAQSLFAPLPSQQIRTYAGGAKSRPSRMVLAPKNAVASRSRPGAATGRRKPTNSPWAATNQTVPRIRAGMAPSAAERNRTRFGGAGAKGKDKDDKEKKEGFHALKMQQSLAQVSYGRRNAIKSRISSIEDFKEFGLLPVIEESIAQEVLTGMDEISPTPIQRLAIPALLGRKQRRASSEKVEAESSRTKSFLLAAETGSGKTLAYLLPTLDALKRHEVEKARTDQVQAVKEAKEKEEQRRDALFELDPPPLSGDEHPNAGKPRAIILVPSAELVDQVGALAKSLSHTVKYRAAVISSTYSGTVIRKRLYAPSGIDLLVSTPHLLASIAQSDPKILSEIRHLIIDEADSLFDRSFRLSTTAILDRAMPTLKQLVLCSATIPRWLDSYVRKVYPDMYRLATPNLHAIPRRVQLGVVDVDRDPYRGNKDLACADTIWQIGESERGLGEEPIPNGQNKNQGPRDSTKRVIVFVNEREKTVELADYLVSKGVDALAFSRDTEARKQTEILADFTGTVAPSSSRSETGLSHASFAPPVRRDQPARKVLADTKVLVVTDLASRGIDTTNVRNVVLYDVPHTTIDFIHRLGRTGRMGRRGRGVVLVGRNDRKDIVREVRDGMFKGQALI